MNIRPILYLSLFLCGGLPAAAQQIREPDATVVTRLTPAGEALRRRLLEVAPEPLGESTAAETVVTIQTFGLAGRDEQPQPRAWVQGISGLYQQAFDQQRRFRETAQPIEFERSGLYFRRDLYSATKGLILHRFLDDRLDLGLYKRRYTPGSTALTGTMGWAGVAESSNKSYVLGGGRQVFVGLRLKLDGIFGR